MDYKNKIDSMMSNRINYETLWQRIALLTSAKDNQFHATGYNHSMMQGESIARNFDTTANRAIKSCASSLVSLITPQSQRWHSLMVMDKDLNEDIAVRDYLQEVTDILFKYRYANKSRFNVSNFNAIQSFVRFGNGAIYPYLNADRDGIVYIQMNLNSLYFKQNRFGDIDDVMICHAMPKEEAKSFFGASCPQDVLDSNTVDNLEFKQLICKITGDEDVSRGEYKSMWFYDGRYDSVLKTEYFNTMPVAICRDISAVYETYGRGMTEVALPEIVNLEAQRKLNLKGLNYLIDPPLATANINNATGNAGSGLRLNLRPGGVTNGGISPEGRSLVQPIYTGTRPDLGHQFIMDSREIINDHYHLNMFQLLNQDNHNMTATEALIRDQEKANALTPILSILESEYLSALIDRELDLLGQLNVLPEPPEILLEQNIAPVYSSPLTMSQNSGKNASMLQTLEFVMQMANYDPSLLNNIDLREVLKQLANNNNTPVEILRNKEEAQEMTQQQQDMQNQMAQQQLLNTASQSTKNLAEAQATNRGD